MVYLPSAMSCSVTSLRPAAFLRDHHEVVLEHVDARTLVNIALFNRGVHGALRSGDQQVGIGAGAEHLIQLARRLVLRVGEGDVARGRPRCRQPGLLPWPWRANSPRKPAVLPVRPWFQLPPSRRSLLQTSAQTSSPHIATMAARAAASARMESFFHALAMKFPSLDRHGPTRPLSGPFFQKYPIGTK